MRLNPCYFSLSSNRLASVIKITRFISRTTLLLTLVSTAVLAQKQAADNRAAIKEADLKRDVYKLADDHFQGRVAGSLNELKASAWIAEQFRAMGLQP
ncbi:MAG: peptidase M28, partial [Cytophagaceae bacterium]